MGQRTIHRVIVCGFALLALALAATGLYSVVSYTVAQRTREFGIRLAMGAQRGDVMQLAFRSTALMVFFGGMLGISVGSRQSCDDSLGIRQLG